MNIKKKNKVRYDVEVTTIQEVSGSKVVNTQVALLMQKIETDYGEILIPHPLNDYIIKMYSTVNSQRKIASVLCDFMRFIYQEIELGNIDYTDIKNRGIYGLKWFHASDYLTYCYKELKNSYNTQKDKEKHILKVYKYLIDLSILDADVVLEEYTHIKEDGEIVRNIINPFYKPETKVKRPENVKNPIGKIKDMNTDQWRTLIKLAKTHEPDIAFGLYIQMMGGLRRGEVVNLTTDAVTVDIERQEIQLYIKDRQDVLFENRDINLSESQVKRSRGNQRVYNPFMDLLKDYNKHLKRITDLKVKSKYQDKVVSSALFVTSNGLPMSGDSYRQKFYNVKRIFLQYIKNEYGYSEYIRFKNDRWGTHVGRGIFTNYLIKHRIVDDHNGVPNPVLLAGERGDTSKKSSQQYMDEYNKIRAIGCSIDNLRNNLLNDVYNEEGGV